MEEHNITYKILSMQQREIWPLDEVKNYLRISSSVKNDDELIISLISTAAQYAENFTRFCIFNRKIQCTIDCAPKNFHAKYIPAIAVTKATLINREIQKDIIDDFGHIDSDCEKIWLSSKYYYQKLEFEYEAGWGQNIPRTIMHGILMHIGHMYDLGEGISISNEIRDMYLPYRKIKI